MRNAVTLNDAGFVEDLEDRGEGRPTGHDAAQSPGQEPAHGIERDANVNSPYASQQRQALNNAPPQAAEGWALIEMARRLDEAANQTDTPERLEILRDLVRRNWKMWTILQAAFVDPECTVPREIRENLLNLSNFIDRRSVDFLAEPDTAKLAVLININRQIGAGLMGNPSDDPEEAERLRREHAAQVGAAAQPAEGETPRADEEAGPGGQDARGSAATDTEV